MSGNDLGPEGARALSEPLGKLTALQILSFSSKIYFLVFTWAGLCCGSETLRGVGLFFIIACQATTLYLKGRGLSLSRSAN